MKRHVSPQPEPIAPVPRRTFLASAATVTAGFTIVPRHVLGGGNAPAPSDKLNIAAVGIGGMGKSNLKRCETENITALCDVDFELAAEVFEKYPNAKRYKDFRVMLEEQSDIDAVIVATPDHSHAVIAMAAMERKKHVYVQKPLTHSVSEARLLTEAARKHGVVSQMGNQGHSGEGARLLCEWVWDGAIGPIREAHAWTNRPVWPSGVEVGRPTDTPEVPPDLDWDLWLGPAQARPYHPAYHPAKWRAWWDFGTGSLGDMACHIVDPIFWALKLKYPAKVEAHTSQFWSAFFEKAETKNEMFPRSTIVRYGFPAREDMPEVNVTWWDGGLMPPRPAGLELGRRMGDNDGGILLIGDRGAIMGNCYGESPRLVPEKAMRRYRPPRRTLERIPEGPDGHEQEWIRAIKEDRPAISNFDYSGPLSETVLMGNLAIRFPGKELLWDGEAMEVTNNEDANAYVRREYREGWRLPESATA
ncbi:MAG: Gfo/Idh/MocA family oxidoreductase [Acidobacteria bacterium]|jgi:predicted dehydrogenase|nr:Gfo/Idh/MocA family oxidoreductase [Acidobacteriota bacterium]